jgi:hypothetical protein
MSQKSNDSLNNLEEKDPDVLAGSPIQAANDADQFHSSTLRDLECASEELSPNINGKSSSITQRLLNKLVSNADLTDPGPPPDGGIAWWQAGLAHLVWLVYI